MLSTLKIVFIYLFLEAPESGAKHSIGCEMEKFCRCPVCPFKRCPGQMSSPPPKGMEIVIDLVFAYYVPLFVSVGLVFLCLNSYDHFWIFIF